MVLNTGRLDWESRALPTRHDAPPQPFSPYHAILFQVSPHTVLSPFNCPFHTTLSPPPGLERKKSLAPSRRILSLETVFIAIVIALHRV